mmetsp:Transcript_9120/g.15785  ORF Transcript_9120/g.15785 Transcript_9120/m.15785 type:complete len:496 (-) Transcript_9120:105-1592(-)
MLGGKETPTSSIQCQSQKERLQSFCFCIALTVNFVDQLWQFTLPVIVPYGVMLGADLKTVAFFTTARGFGGILSNLWMPWLADGPKGGQPRRKLAVLVSLIGCTLGYLTQGSASSFKPGPEASHVFALGRFLTGFFSGMGPVLSAYITEISNGDHDLLKNRFKYLQMTNAVLGLCLAPLAGALATLGLQVPFFVATGLGIMTFMVAAAYFKEASEFSESSTGARLGAPSEDSRSPKAIVKVTSEGSPYCGAVTWLIAMANACLTLIFSGYMFFMPTLISQPSFGIQGRTQAIKQRHVAAMTGLLGLPFSFSMILSTVLLFMPLTKRFGDVSTSLVGAFVLSVTLAAVGFVTQELWMIALLNFFNGLMFGTFTPGLLPFFSRYVSRVFPTQQAVAQGVPLTAGQVAVMFAQNIMADVISNYGVAAASCYMGMCIVAFGILFSVANLIAWRSEARDCSLQESLLSVADPEKDAAPTLLTGRDAENSALKTEKALTGI